MLFDLEKIQNTTNAEMETVWNALRTRLDSLHRMNRAIQISHKYLRNEILDISIQTTEEMREDARYNNLDTSGSRVELTIRMVEFCLEFK